MTTILLVVVLYAAALAALALLWRRAWRRPAVPDDARWLADQPAEVIEPFTLDEVRRLRELAQRDASEARHPSNGGRL